MSQQELLISVTRTLTTLGIDYMITGSTVSSLQGEPRSTHDIDLVVIMSVDVARKLTVAFPPPDFFLSEEAVVDAVRRHSMFNLISLKEGEKVDFWMLTNEPFDLSRFARKRTEQVVGVPLTVSTPEDTILAKLRWCKLSGGSEKQFTDALRVYEVQNTKLDFDYLNHWVPQLGVGDLWKRLQSDAQCDQSLP